MPSLEEGGAMPRAAHADNEDTGIVLKLVLESQERQTKTLAKSLDTLAGEVRELRSDVQRLAPSPRLVMAAFGTIVLAGVSIIAFLIGGVLMLRGVDPRVAAEAAREVVETVQPVTVSDTDVGEE